MNDNLTPMMKQYMEIKAQHQDSILFYRLGDFYEMFFEDALLASKELEITLTGKSCGLEERAPMCGVPYHASDSYITKLIGKGYKVAIAEQVEDPATAKGIVRREVVRIMTPGVNLNMSALDATKNNYLLCVCQDQNQYGLSYVDVTTGDFYTTQLSGYYNLIDELSKIQPAEIILNRGLNDNPDFIQWNRNAIKSLLNPYDDWYFEYNANLELLKRHFQVANLDGLGIGDDRQCVITSGGLLRYVYDTQKSGLQHIDHLKYYAAADYMILDSSTRRNLELTETMREKEKRGSLYGILDKTKTAMGARRLRHMIEQPLLQVQEMNRRLDGVGELVGDLMLREEMRELLTPIYDITRLMTKISLETANPRDLLAFNQSIQGLPDIKLLCGQTSSSILKQISDRLDPLTDLFALIDDSINPEAPILVREAGILKNGYNEQVDKLRSASKDGKKWLATLEVTERNRTGIKNLKVKYNKVFGYYIEVTKSYLDLVPDDYERKQTMSNGERYITPELKEIENTVLGAEDKLKNLEYDLFVSIRKQLGESVNRIKQTADDVSWLDALQALATVAVSNDYVRPQFNEQATIEIKQGRHPVIEKMIGRENFIVNDTLMNHQENRFSIITGPNMAGKSTYMRQVALITLMAQIGSFVPAFSCDVCPVDRIFTRVGASDDLASGKSTFMVEMSEVANILRNATPNSLVILDEIGRGTSTFDGLSIAWAVVEYLVSTKSIGAKTLFATHYHELTELEGKIEGVANYCITVKEEGDHIIFLRKINKGGADKSYGIQVAKLAGVPIAVVVRAKEILNELSDADITKKTRNLTVKKNFEQMNLFQVAPNPVLEELDKININNLTPIQALNQLEQLIELRKKG